MGGLSPTSNLPCAAQLEQPDYTAALEHAKRALELVSKLGNPKLELQSLSTLGWIYTRIPDPTNANTYLKQAIDLALQLKEEKVAGNPTQANYQLRRATLRQLGAILFNR